jgi:hypothetical protein
MDRNRRKNKSRDGETAHNTRGVHVGETNVHPSGIETVRKHRKSSISKPKPRPTHEANKENSSTKEWKRKRKNRDGNIELLHKRGGELEGEGGREFI